MMQVKLRASASIPWINNMKLTRFAITLIGTREINANSVIAYFRLQRAFINIQLTKPS